LENPPINPFRARFDFSAGSKASWAGLHGSSLAPALLSAASAHPGQVLVLCRSSHQAAVLEKDLGLFNTGDLPVMHLPDRETLPYDPFSAHPDIAAERMAALAAAAGQANGILIVPPATLLQRLPPRSHVLGQSLDLGVGETLSIDAFRSQLLHAGYTASEQVYQAGQFAVRGSVLDLFPSGLRQPIRIDLFDEEIEAIRTFDPESQRWSDFNEGKRHVGRTLVNISTINVGIIKQNQKILSEAMNPQPTKVKRKGDK